RAIIHGRSRGGATGERSGAGSSAPIRVVPARYRFGWRRWRWRHHRVPECEGTGNDLPHGASRRSVAAAGGPRGSGRVVPGDREVDRKEERSGDEERGDAEERRKPGVTHDP